MACMGRAAAHARRSIFMAGGRRNRSVLTGDVGERRPSQMGGSPARGSVVTGDVGERRPF